MRWLASSLLNSEPGDFLPTLVGTVILFISLPGLIMLLVNADPGSGVVAVALMVLFGAGALLGLCFVVVGIRLCSYPGSLAYRLTRGRISWR
jgi:hypothetical protein